MSYTDDFFKELNKKNKKNKKEENDTTKNKTKSNSGYANEFYSALNDDIAPLPSTATRYSELAPTVVAPAGGEKDSWFKTGGFSDGVDGVGDFFGDLGETVAGTVGDLSLGMVKGVGRTVEGIVDLGTYAVGGVGGLLGFDDFKEKAKKVAQYNATDEWTKPATDFLDQYSVLGNKADMVSEGLGQVATILLTAGVGAAAGLGSAGVTALTTGVTGLSSMGTGIGNAYSEDANDTEAFLYGLGAGAIEAGTELLSGGLGKAVKALGISRGIGGLDDIFAKKLSSTIVKSISNESVQKILGNTIEAGVKAGGEGLEEVLSGLGSAVMKWLTYEKDEDIKKLIEDEDLLEQFVVGAITSSIAQGADYVKANKSGRDFVTGYTNSEQAVIDKEVEKRVSEKEKNGSKLTNKEIVAIEEQVRNDMEHGQLNIETIEEVLGGEKYTAYKDTVKNEEALKAEYDRLADIKKSDLTTKQEKRLAELEAMNLEDTTKRNSLRKELNDTVFPQLNDSKLAESYKEIERQDQKFEVDLTKYKGKQREAVERAVKSGVLNNTYRSHVLVDTLSRIEADKGITFDYTNNKKLKESGFAVEGVRVNGYANKSTGTVTLNVQSKKAWQSVVGHEITHILKGTKHYTALKDALFAYAESKGELANRRTALTELYQNLDADVDEELTADLVGDYLFTDKAFINRLTGNRTLFQKVYDEIKYLWSVATGKEKADIEKVKREFDRAWKEVSAKGLNGTDGKNQYSLDDNGNVIPLSERFNADNDDIRFSLSSMANTFYGDENMSSVAFEERDYKQTVGYKNYVNQCVNNMRQTRSDFDETVARKEIENQIDGIVRVALAAKKAGYDIHDDAVKREKTDSKKRLLFSSLEPNSDYFTSSDISTICDKRQNFAEIYDDIVRAEEAKGVPRGKRFFDNVDNYFYLHKILADKGLTQPCRQCYVESMRKNLAPMANAFLRLVNETDANNKANDQLYQQSGKNKGELKSSNAELREKVLEVFEEHPEYEMSASDLTVEMLTTENGLAQLKIQAPLIYEAFNSFYGQSKPKMPKSATPFRFGELTALLTDDNGRIKQSLVNRINSTGGFRLQSYSDFQIQNYTDVLQVIFEAGTLGLNGHAYTKVPAFLEATDGTNLKRNISIFMYKDGNEWKIDRNDSFPYELDEIYDIVNSDESGNTSIIAVSQNKEMSAWIMANDNVGMGIPFHKSGMKMGTVRDTDVKTDDGRIVKGYSGTIDHTKQQTEVWAKASADHKALTKVKKGIDIYSFWDFDNKANLSNNELIEKNLKAYIDACDEAGYLPKFRDYVMNNGSVLNDVLRFSKELGFVPYNATIEDISFEYKGYRIPYGYYKFLVDFGIFKPDGTAAPHETLSLNNYDFDKAVAFFADSEKLRRNEILQQFANGEERRKYRDSNLSAEELTEIVNKKRKEVVDSIVAPDKFSLSGVNEQYAPTGDYSTPFNELAYDEDVAPVEAVTSAKEAAKPVTNTDEGYPDNIVPMTEEEANSLAKDYLNSLTEEDAPPEMPEPYYGEEDAPVDLFEDRDIIAVGRRSVKAYMYENPEVKPFFQAEANIMLGDLARTTRGERVVDAQVLYDTNGENGVYGLKRNTSPEIAYLKDEFGYTYDEIKAGLKAIIEDDGAENNACSKRIEFMLNDRLMNGYRDFVDGIEIPANQEYIRLVREKGINEYNEEARKHFFENADSYAPPVENDIAPVMGEKTAPAADDIAPSLENIPVLPDEELDSGTHAAIKPQPNKQTANQNNEPKLKRRSGTENNQSEKIAKVLVEEPEVEKKKSGILSKAIANFIGKGAAIENLSLKTKNRDLQAKYKTISRSETKATYLMEHGTEGVKSLDEIRAEVEKTGKVQDFYDYMYHMHNIDRMSLESKELPNLQRLTGEMAELKLLDLKENQLRAIASEKITKETSPKRANIIKTVREYLASKDVKNKPVYGYPVTAEISQDMANKLEAENPEFKKYAQDVYDYMNYLRKMMVDNGIISEDTAKLWAEMYPHYVPIRREGKDGYAIDVPLDTYKTGINAPIKGATGGNSNILPLFNTIAQRTMQTFKAVDKNRFGIELKNTLGGVVESTKTNLDEVIDSIDAHESLLQEGKNGKNPTFTVFENGNRVTFDITEEIYDALKPTSKGLSYTNKALNTVSKLHRGLLTKYNPVFMATNAIKDAQDVLINSQHPAKTYANFPVAIKELTTKGKWYTEYMENGGGDNTYFDKQTNTFKKEKSALRKIVGFPLDKIPEANDFIEKVPRLAEYIASREGGASVDVAMLDAARVTTDFSSGGDVTKFLDRNGATFLNASVQGFAQQIRNVREAKMNGLKGWLGLAAKCAIAGLPTALLNKLLWDDDEEYAELSDYVKENYYVVAKYGDGKFVRIPKGRTLAVIQNGFEQIGNALTGDDEVDFNRFFELFISNLAPNNPLDNNIIAPIKQAVENKTWYGEDLVPKRLQDLPAGEQYDESTDSISKWLGENLNKWLGENLNISPYKINYLLNQYSGGVGDVLLPMLTPEAESGDNSFVGKLIAPMRDKFTTDSIMNNQNISDFYDKMDELTTNAKSSAATDEDILKYKYFNSVNKELGELYGSKREIQNAPYSDDIKYKEIRDIQKQIVSTARETLSAYNKVVIDGDYATVGDRHFHKNEKGEWEKISDDQFEKQKEVTKELGISSGEYWSSKSEYDYAYKNPDKYAVAKAVGGYSAYKTYSSELYDIKSDKDENGKSISGSRKEKVIDYINNLDADYYTKIILFKSEYPSDDTYNADIVNYVINSDFTYDEKASILTELGFRVTADGEIYAD